MIVLNVVGKLGLRPVVAMDGGEGVVESLPATPAGRFQLSRAGSGRATAYAEANKIVTRGDRTHVAWLDCDADGFAVRVCSLDRRTGAWSTVHTVGRAQDNHGGPGLTIDQSGHLHVFYFPHHEAMRYRRSVRPNDASAWEPEETFGENLTYPVPMVARDGAVWITARRSHDDAPWETERWMRRAEGGWERVATLLRSRVVGRYAQFQETFVWGADHRTLHMAVRIYENPAAEGGEVRTTVGYLRSPDGGQRWERGDGTPVDLPATADTVDVIARASSRQAETLGNGGLYLDDEGRPRIFYSVAGHAESRLLEATLGGSGWRTRDLAEFLPPDRRGWSLATPSAVTRTPDGTVVLVATVQQPEPGVLGWAHPTNEVVRLESRDGGRSFGGAVLGPKERAQPRWLPNIERNTGFNPVPAVPGIILTDGSGGKTLEERLENQVWWQP